jgi:hypothetical protein
MKPWSGYSGEQRDMHCVAVRLKESKRAGKTSYPQKWTLVQEEGECAAEEEERELRRGFISPACTPRNIGIARSLVGEIDIKAMFLSFEKEPTA